jgi:hypothetical protein
LHLSPLPSINNLPAASALYIDIKEVIQATRRSSQLSSSRRANVTSAGSDLDSASQAEHVNNIQMLRDTLAVIMPPYLDKDADLLRASLLGAEVNLSQAISTFSGYVAVTARIEIQ